MKTSGVYVWNYFVCVFCTMTVCSDLNLLSGTIKASASQTANRTMDMFSCIAVCIFGLSAVLLKIKQLCFLYFNISVFFYVRRKFCQLWNLRSKNNSGVSWSWRTSSTPSSGCWSVQGSSLILSMCVSLEKVFDPGSVGSGEPS